MEPGQPTLPSPPVPDRALDAELAIAAVREQLPELDARAAEPLGSGWSSEAYLVDDRWVARFPWNREIAERIDRLEPRLRMVEATVGDDVRVPAVRGRGRGGTHFPHDFLVCDFVPGVPANAPGAVIGDELAADLGRAISAIHRVPVARARAAGVGLLEGRSREGPVAVLHAGLVPENLILDTRTGRLAGIIDWGTTAIGDPAMELVPLLHWRGPGFVRRVLDAYEGPVDDTFMSRAQRAARLVAMAWIAASVRRGDDPSLYASWLSNAYGESPGEPPHPT